MRLKNAPEGHAAACQTGCECNRESTCVLASVSGLKPVTTKVAVGKLLGRIKHEVFYPKGDHVYVGSFAVGKEPSEASTETFVKQMRVQNSADFAKQNQASECNTRYTRDISLQQR